MGAAMAPLAIAALAGGGGAAAAGGAGIGSMLVSAILPALVSGGLSLAGGSGPITAGRNALLGGVGSIAQGQLSSLLSPSANEVSGIGQSAIPQSMGLSVADPLGAGGLGTAGLPGLGAISTAGLPGLNIMDELLRKNPLLNIGGGIF